MSSFIENPEPEFIIPESWSREPTLKCVRIIGERYWLETLQQHAFRLQKASKFLDKEDCVGICTGRLTPDAVKEHLQGGSDSIVVPDEYAKVYSEKSCEILNKRLRERNFVDFAYWILCVSDEMLLDKESEAKAWREYATEAHEGVRFHFNFPMLKHHLCRVRRVKYSDNKPSIDLSKIHGDVVRSGAYADFIEECIFTKNAHQYSWEHELRFLVDDRATFNNCHDAQILHKRESYEDYLHPYLVVPLKNIKRVVFGKGVSLSSVIPVVKRLKQDAMYKHIVFQDEGGQNVG